MTTPEVLFLNWAPQIRNYLHNSLFFILHEWVHFLTSHSKYELLLVHCGEAKINCSIPLAFRLPVAEPTISIRHQTVITDEGGHVQANFGGMLITVKSRMLPCCWVGSETICTSWRKHNIMESKQNRESCTNPYRSLRFFLFFFRWANTNYFDPSFVLVFFIFVFVLFLFPFALLSKFNIFSFANNTVNAYLSAQILLSTHIFVCFKQWLRSVALHKIRHLCWTFIVQQYLQECKVA